MREGRGVRKVMKAERGIKIKWEIERESEQQKERREGGDNETETRVRRWAEG